MYAFMRRVAYAIIHTALTAQELRLPGAILAR